MSWLVAINIAAPVVKPTTTVCETKLTREPSRANPKASWYKPARKVSVNAMPINSGEPGSACPLNAEKTTIEIAAVGPEIKCFDDPKKAAITGVIIAVYKPYCGGKPAIAA